MNKSIFTILLLLFYSCSSSSSMKDCDHSHLCCEEQCYCCIENSKVYEDGIDPWPDGRSTNDVDFGSALISGLYIRECTRSTAMGYGRETYLEKMKLFKNGSFKIEGQKTDSYIGNGSMQDHGIIDLDPIVGVWELTRDSIMIVHLTFYDSIFKLSKTEEFILTDSQNLKMLNYSKSNHFKPGCDERLFNRNMWIDENFEFLNK